MFHISVFPEPFLHFEAAFMDAVRTSCVWLMRPSPRFCWLAKSHEFFRIVGGRPVSVSPMLRTMLHKPEAGSVLARWAR